jgi:tetratricopeptide (TPR) repeat protein
MTLSVALLILITIAVFCLRRSRPYLFVGWLWYLIALLPVIGLIQVGLQVRADRYTYLPQIGLCLAIAGAIAALPIRTLAGRRTLCVLAIGIIALLASQATRQTSYWANTETLWTHATAVTANNDFAHYNLGAIFLARGQLDDAISNYEQALATSGDRETHDHVSASLIHNNLGIALARQGELDRAIAHFKRAIELQDGFADAHVNLADMLERVGDNDAAIADYEKALSIPPEDAPTHLRLAALLWRIGRKHDGMVHYSRALHMAPRSVPPLKAFVEAANKGTPTAALGR